MTDVTLSDRVAATLRDVPDFPKPGILFSDISPVLADGELFAQITNHFAARHAGHDLDAVVGIESRGFIFGAPVANALGVGFVLVRKPGKLPGETIGQDYALEYGTDRVEVQADALKPGARVVIVDDLLATGGTASAAVELVKKLGAEVVEVAFLIELDFLKGRDKLDAPCHALVHR